MAFDVVKQIIDVEREGEDLIIKVRMEASEILKSAREKSDSVVHKAKMDAEEYYKNVISKYEGEANEESKPIIDESLKMKEQLENIPSELLDKALNMVIERIVNSHGDS